MIRINLLPVREIKRRIQAKQQIIFFVLGLVTLLVFLGLAGFLQASKAGRLQQELTKIKQEKQRYAKVLKQIKQLEEDKNLLEKQIAIIHKLKSESSLTVHILDEVANRTPAKRMWLTSLSQKGNTLKLKGMALDNRTIAGYMESLKQSPYIKTVNLANSSLKSFAGRNLKSFSLSCTIGVPEKNQDKNNQQGTAKKQSTTTMIQREDAQLDRFAGFMHVVPPVQERERQNSQQTKS